jgi:hypothetical protein
VSIYSAAANANVVNLIIHIELHSVKLIFPVRMNQTVYIYIYGLCVILSTLQDKPLLLTHCAHAHCLQFEHSGNGLMSHIRETSKVTIN